MPDNYQWSAAFAVWLGEFLLHESRRYNCRRGLPVLLLPDRQDECLDHQRLDIVQGL